MTDDSAAPDDPLPIDSDESGVTNASRSRPAAGDVQAPLRLQATPAVLRHLATLGKNLASMTETALLMGVTEPELVAFLDDHPEARLAFERGRAITAVTIRASQIKLATTNPRMAAWLGMQYLHQTAARPAEADDGKRRKSVSLDDIMAESDERERVRVGAPPGVYVRSPDWDL